MVITTAAVTTTTTTTTTYNVNINTVIKSLGDSEGLQILSKKKQFK